MNNKSDWVGIWNAWIDFCKKPIAYDFAMAFMFSLIAYSIIGLGSHYVLDVEARQANNQGIAYGIFIFISLIIVLGLQNGWIKDLFKDMDKEVEE